MNAGKNEFAKCGPSKTSFSIKEIDSHECDLALTRRIQLAKKRHEMRTPLNAIIGYSEMLLEDEESRKHEQVFTVLERIHSSGKEILEIFDKIFILGNVDGNNVDNGWCNHEADLTDEIRRPLTDIIGDTERLIATSNDLDLKSFIPDLEKIYKSSEYFMDFIVNIGKHATNAQEAAGHETVDSGASAMIKDLVGSILPGSERRDALVSVDECQALIVEDNIINRDLLSRHLEKQGHLVTTAENGRQALEIIQKQSFDVIFLDILMPEMNGYQVLKKLKQTPAWKDIPVIMISALEEMDVVAHCIEIGADDYLVKPFNHILLDARITSCLERKRLYDLEKEQKRILKETFGKYVDHEVRDEVLSGRIPLGGELKDVTVLFADLRNFTPLTESTPPTKVVEILNSYFTEMEPVISAHRGSLLRYVGDEIFAVFGAPLALKHHFRHALEAAIEMRQRLVVLNEKLLDQGFTTLSHGIGIHSGLVIAANIGSPDRLAYDLVGDAVNLASRIQELTKEFDTDILISSTTKYGLDKNFAMEALPAVTVKGRKAPTEIFRLV